MKDKLGFAFHEGCKIVRAVADGQLQICTVTKIADGKMYLDDSKIAIKHPSRLLIIEQDLVYKMVKNYKK